MPKRGTSVPSRGEAGDASSQGLRPILLCRNCPEALESVPGQEGRGMRTFVLAIAAVILAVSFSTLPVSAQTPRLGAVTPQAAVPELTIQIRGEATGTSFVFVPAVILVPQ